MRAAFDHQNKLILQVRTESGSVSIEVGLEWLTKPERKFLHQLVKNTHEGGTVGFGVEPGEESESVIKLTLKAKPKDEQAKNVTPS